MEHVSQLPEIVMRMAQDAEPRINVSVERNTKGYNWSATVTGARSVDEAIMLLMEANGRLRGLFEQKLEVS